MNEADESESIKPNTKERSNISSSKRDQDGQQKAAKEQMLRVIFTSEARERLSNIRMVKPDLADSVENQIIQLAASGRLRKQIDDEELKTMLESFQRPKKEFKINWK